MADELGDFASGKTVRYSFASADASGAKKPIVGGVAAVLRDGGTTPITAGVSLVTGFAGIEGHNRVTVDTTDANTFPRGSDYEILLTAGTIDSIPMAGEPLATFSIENRVANANSAAILASINAGQNLGYVNDVSPQQSGFIIGGPAADRMEVDNCYLNQFLYFTDPADKNKAIPVKITGCTASNKHISITPTAYPVLNTKTLSITGKTA